MADPDREDIVRSEGITHVGGGELEHTLRAYGSAIVDICWPNVLWGI